MIDIASLAGVSVRSIGQLNFSDGVVMGRSADGTLVRLWAIRSIV